MLTIQEFQAMCFDDKAEMVFVMGDYIATRPYYNFNVNLYSLFGFLVEVWYFCPDNQIEKIEVLNSNKVYSLYTQNVVLKDFYTDENDHLNF